MTLRFENPPRPGGSRTDWGQVAAELRENPGKWALVGTAPTKGAAAAKAYQIKTAKAVPFTPAGSFDATSRAVDGEFRIYACCLETGGS